jgi:putative tricarboxylic transport membrane protein
MVPLLRVVGALIASAVALSAGTAAYAQAELKITAPAAPGGGWDQTARSMQQALMQSGVARSVQVVNVTGAGGTVGLAQFINGAKAMPRSSSSTGSSCSERL